MALIIGALVMAATFIRALLFRSVLLFLLSSLAVQSYNGDNLSRPYRAYYYYRDFGRVYFVSCQLTIASSRVCSAGFCRTKFALVKWTKRGQTSMVIPGHDPPLDITVFMDILKNPGPEESNLERSRRNQVQHSGADLHTNNTEILTYSRGSLLSIRRKSTCKADSSVYGLLKSYGLLKFRGCRAGRRRISVVASRRPNHIARLNRSITRTLVNISIVPAQCNRVQGHLKLCSINARSVKNKSADFVCYVRSSGADIFAITETWLTENDIAHRVEVTPPGYKLLDHPRVGRIGGGTALLFKEFIHTSKVEVGQLKSFEFSEWIVEYGSCKLRIVVLYRPPYSTNHPVTTRVFFDEFTNYLETIILSSEPLLITGDFNIHVDVADNSDGVYLLELLESMGLQQHIDKPTYESEHTLDLIITRRCDSILAGVPVTDYLFSDHLSVICDLRLGRPVLPTKKVSYRKIGAVDTKLLCDELSTTKLCQHSPDALNELVECYNTTLAEALDRHAPVITKTITSRPLVPWYSDVIKEARRERRKAERRWRRTGSMSDLVVFKAKKNHTTHLMNEARRVFYTNFIDENSSNQKNLFKATKKLLKQSNDVPFPPFIDKSVLADQMGSFFVQKINSIYSKLDNMATGLPNTSCDSDSESASELRKDSFTVLTEEDVVKLIKSSAIKSCVLDPMPTSMVISCLDVLLPVLTKIINLSLQSGMFADDWKCALVYPLLKKLGLELLFKNYRPVSNLQYVSKLTERAVFNQTHDHMVINDMYPTLQSSYRQHHSTETTLLKVMNHILLKMNSQHVSLLVLLDLSAAFDTVNHKIMLDRMHTKVGISGKALDWFNSYLSGRSQRISVDGIVSNRFDLEHGVPQGSCLGPLLFIIYTSKLFEIIDRHLPDAHCYADDTQLYLSFKPDSRINQSEAVLAMEKCIDDIRQWMIHDRLMINDDKTEFLLIGTRQQLSKLESCTITVGDIKINPTSCARNLGSWFDSKLCMSTHITKMCNAAFFHLHNIRRIKKYLSRDALLMLVHAFITSRLDYCNSLLYGLPKSQTIKLQRVQNAAARLVFDMGKYTHITPALYELHWLPVSSRIHFKILLLTFKAIYGLSPSYLSDLITIKPKSAYSLRSNDSLFLERPTGKMLPTLGARSFTAAAPELWNSLPNHIREIKSISIFKKTIKTYLFQAAFSNF